MTTLSQSIMSHVHAVSTLVAHIMCLIFIISLNLVLSAVIAQNNDTLFELNIIHYNDFHAHFDEITLSGGPCNPTEEDCIGGLSRLYTAIMQVMEAEPDSLLLNAGDTFQGTIWYNLLGWNVSQHFMNMLPHDAHVLGNHEFDRGVEGLVPYLQRLQSPMLGANVNTTFEPEMDPFVKNHVVIKRNGRSIGIIGILLQTFSASIGKAIMEDELEAVNREAAILTEQGVDIIIVLSHVGYDSDMKLAALMSSDVDIIVGGHTHSLLYNEEAPDGSTVEGEYPTIVTQDNGHRILIVQASCYTRYLGNIKLYFDEAGKILSWTGHPIYLGTSIVKDPFMESLLEPWRREVDAIGKEVLGTALTPLQRGCYGGECVIGNWACDGLIEEMIPYAAEGAWGAAHVCLMNSGGFRGQIDSGELTTERLLMALPFTNFVQLFELKGEYLLQALEHSLSTFQDDPQSFFSRRMLQMSGMRNVYNASAPAGARVLSSSVRCLRCDVPRYEPLDPAATYTVVTQGYLGDGGQGFTMLLENRQNLVTLEQDYVVLQQNVRRQRLVLQDLDGRVRVVY